MQKRRKADSPPLSPPDDEIVAGRPLSDQRADIEIAVPRDVDGETTLHNEDQEQTEDQADGEEGDVGQKLVVGKKRLLAGRGLLYGDRRGGGLKRCSWSWRYDAASAKSVGRHESISRVDTALS
ncbi:hypothetical protein [Bradyrhizobium sp. NBAIM16]|uniref:hypothetical protein n=1 Tax=Bradyrhizobium sp. NBAIM16 TaxID=2793813 RepID=UPI001CD7B970|nr:hypothetical protein [Bradyrhizobium sp. NBAIM16]